MLPPAAMLPKLLEIADAAAAVVMEHYAQASEVRMKEDRSPVTAADGAAEERILEQLTKLTPGIPVVAEEAAAAGRIPDVGDDPFWLVDPLDGTKEFISKNGEFTVNIALIEQRRPVMGVVVAPAVGKTWWGARGHGATKRQADGSVHDIRVRKAPPRGGVAVASRSHRDAATNQWLESKGITDTVAAGSSLKFCLVAEAAADYYPRFGPTMEWDTGAGHAVLAAAGGRVTTVDGAPFLYNKPDFRNAGFIALGGD